MALLQWKDQYSVGIAAVDHEHRELIELINRLHDELSASRATPVSVEEFFGDLLKSISSHFALEERFMRDEHYDHLAQHKADHERLLDDIRDMMDDVIGEAEVNDLSARLDAWFSRHVETHDARLHKALGVHPH
ncbi:MAG: bacteriohemerythrin [Hyphomicrobiales bacterium]|nr:bacteriohemerythrin [Hyphomicrobiales bacterium]